MYATCSTISTDAATAEAIEALVTETPEGLIAHVAGPTEDGWRIIDVWVSEEHSRRFNETVLFPAVVAVVGKENLGHAPAPLTVTGQLELLGKGVLTEVSL